jgi:mono/diheme cytochrome c family protein
MDRLIIESIEGRISLGITMFVALMILIGWVMINEPYRMASFEEQHLGRSMEQGAELFAANCTTCHGTNGQGILGKAPALNNPQLFEYDFVSSVRVTDEESPFVGNTIADLQRAILDLYTQQQELTAQYQRIEEELGAENPPAEERAAELTFQSRLIEAQLNANTEAVQSQLADLDAGNLGDLTEAQAEQLRTALENNIPLGVANRIAVLEGDAGLYAERDAILAQIQTARANGYLPNLDAVRSAIPDRTAAEAIEDEAERLTSLIDWIEGELAFTNYIANDSSRLRQIEWGGDLRGYITTTLIHGRPGSNLVWPDPMVSWSQEGGGPLRRDQIDNIVNYILNWDKGDNWTLADLGSVTQFARLHADASLVGTTTTTAEIVQPDISALPAGDAANGETVYATVGCGACHTGGAVGPDTAGTWARVQDERLAEPQFEGWTGEEYLYFSIMHPGDYIVEGYANVMPPTIGAALSEQDIADIIAFLQTQ